MPEGDSVLQLSNRLQFMAGREVTGCSVRVPRYATVDFTGMTCERVWPYGKHLFMQFGEQILHTHLKMEGTWAIHYAGDRWRKPGHTARIVLQLANSPRDIEVVGHQLGFVDIYPADHYHQRIAHLGPDILDSDWDREKLQERLAKLAGGIGVIRVGAATEVELKERKHRIEDAVSSTRAALEEGIVAGGGTALINALSVLDTDADVQALTGDAASGVDIVRKALKQPLRWIAQNAGEDGYVVVSKVAELEPNHGFNAKTGVYGDLIADGVIDPVKVTRSALANAASIAALVLTTETLVADKPAEEDEADHQH